jgi:hypothetical protein
MECAMSKELWATYSVKDHLDPRGLAADIMLFDRLVFPVPETPRIGGDPTVRGEVEWTINPEEWKRWEEVQKWDPASQKRLLDEVLKPVIRKVAWNSTAPLYDEYRTEAAKLASQNVPDYAFVASRTVLTRDLPAYVTGVEALGPAYRTVEAIERDLGIRRAGKQTQLPQSALATVLAWQFFAPDPKDKKFSSPEELLKEAVAFVTGDPDFKKHRTEFIKWQQEFLSEGVTDRDAIDRAVKDMGELLENAQRAAAKLTVRKVARYAFRVAPSLLTLGLAAAGVVGGIAAATGGVFLSLGGIAVEEKLFKAAEQGTPPPAAFVYDARRHFGWKRGPSFLHRLQASMRS